MRTANPALNENVFRNVGRTIDMGQVMTIQGTINKTLMLLGLVVLSAGYTWNLVMTSGDPAVATPWMYGGLFGGLIFAFATIFKPTWAPYTSPVYAVLQGLFIGGISVVFNATYPGIVGQATLLTFGTLGVMLAAYKTGLIQATERFKLGIIAATGGIALLYFVTIILSFGVSVPFIFGNGAIGIGFSVVVCAIAALNLILDFDFIERGSNQGAPKYMEWYGAFGLMVTLIWLYIEILRLLAKTRSR